MVVCKFFLQGRCKYGQNCKYEHPLNDNNKIHSTSVMRQSTDNVDMNMLVEFVQIDMQNTEKGGQWLLSCYAPFKDKMGFPGFHDRSFEEVRFGFYEATKTGTVEHYVQQLQTLIKDAATKTKALQNPSPETVHLLTQIYNSPSLNSENYEESQSFDRNSSTSLFLQSTPNFNSSTLNKSIFNQNNQPAYGQQYNDSQSIFGGQKQNMFTVASQNSIFTSSVQNASNNYGGSAQNIFGGTQSPSNSILAQQQPNSVYSPPQNSIFGGQQNSSFTVATVNPFVSQANNTSPFSGQINTVVNVAPFSTQSSNSPFAVQKQGNSPFAATFVTQGSQPLPVFNQVSQSPPFNMQPQQLSSPFGNLPSTPYSSNSPFSAQQTAGSTVFAPQATSMYSIAQQTPFSMLGSIPEENTFSGSKFSSSNAISSSLAHNVYSKIEDLNENEIKAFQSDCFEFGKIPEKPPTIEMCFS